jgi:zinc protease
MKPLLPRLLVPALFALLLPFLPPAAAQAPAPAAPKVEQFTLDNGMTVIVKPDRRAPTAVHMVWVRIGSMDEVDGASGVAHVLEHMMFKGTAELKPGEFSRRVAALGGRENAFTGRDYTGYFQQIPANRLEDVMKLEADRFARNRWADDEFKRELEVVKEERRQRTDDVPRASLHEQLSATAFQASPYRRPIVGWMSDLESMTPDDARDFYRRWYVPANATVVVVGDVDPAEVRRLAQRHYGSIPSRAVPPRKPRVEPVQAGLRRTELKAPAEQAYVALVFKVPQLVSFDPTPQNDDALALTVLAAVLDGYSGARLDRGLVRGPDRVADSAGASNGLWGRGPQVFMLDGVPAPGKTAEQVEAALRAEVAKVAREGVSEAELQRVKTRWIAAEVFKLDSIMNQARELGSAWIQGLPLDASERLIQRLRGVTAAQVQSVAARYFGDDQLTVGTLRPQPLDPNRKPRPPAAGSRH